MQQHYHLGSLFHQRYSTEMKASYLFDNYTRTQIYVRSTDVDRTLMSAQCQLASLFEPSAKQVGRERGREEMGHNGEYRVEERNNGDKEWKRETMEIKSGRDG